MPHASLFGYCCDGPYAWPSYLPDLESAARGGYGLTRIAHLAEYGALRRHPKWIIGFSDITALHVEALNHATRDIPPEAMRIHLCWGNYEGPHHLDIGVDKIIDVAGTACG